MHFLWFKALHLIFMVTWFAGLFYLPRLYVYHAMSTDTVSLNRFKLMERKLYYGIMMPGAVLTLVFGAGMLHAMGWAVYKHALWLHIKFVLILVLILYHIYCGYLRKLFFKDLNKRSHVYYRIINEIPVLFLIAIVLLAVLKPQLG
ncbi:MAG: protoporphyrinogen oxidase HemJ [Gammaproteobacteria bacterium]